MSIGRPNELDPALIVWSKMVADEGTTINEAAQSIRSVKEGRKTERALALSANRLVDKGILVRRLEHTSLTNGQVVRRFRYWHSSFAPPAAIKTEHV